MIRIKNALISCWDKTGLENLAKSLSTHGVRIISSGGTAAHLKNAGFAVTPVDEITGFPEILDGRVKTLHPKIHAALLATSSPEHARQLRELAIEPIQLVVVNLYPFVQEALGKNLPVDQAVEFIDIGGPAMLRAAAKNFRNVVALHFPSLYPEFLEVFLGNDGQIPIEFSAARAREIFFYTSWYDAQIQSYFQAGFPPEKAEDNFLSFHLQKQNDLRYGENPHQSASIYKAYAASPSGFAAARQLWGKPMSFNNYVDVQAAYSLVREFQEPAVVIVKHTNPCGAAVDNADLSAAFRKALRGDPVSAFGGIIAANRKIDLATAEAIAGLFVECVIAPDFDAEALLVLQKKKNLRVIQLALENFVSRGQELKAIEGLFLAQEPDRVKEDPRAWKNMGSPISAENLLADLDFAWKVAKHVKSNAIVIARGKEVYGVGAGQMSRVDSVHLAIKKAKEGGRNLKGAVLASDAFFPFRDSVDVAAQGGIVAIVQPGGSIRDEEIFKAAHEHGLAMFITGIRHFKH